MRRRVVTRDEDPYEQARRRAAERDLATTFLVADALRLERLGRTFDRVLDVGLFHTFGDDDDRRAYVDSLAAAIRPWLARIAHAPMPHAEQQAEA